MARRRCQLLSASQSCVDVDLGSRDPRRHRSLWRELKSDCIMGWGQGDFIEDRWDSSLVRNTLKKDVSLVQDLSSLYRGRHSHKYRTRGQNSDRNTTRSEVYSIVYKQNVSGVNAPLFPSKLPFFSHSLVETCLGFCLSHMSGSQNTDPLDY